MGICNYHGCAMVTKMNQSGSSLNQHSIFLPQIIHRLYNQLTMNNKNLKSFASLTIFILCVLFSILIILSPWNSMNETKNGIQTTVEAEKAGVSFIDLGAATISFNLRKGKGIRYRTQIRLTIVKV